MKNRVAFISGFALFLCFALLTGMGKLLIVSSQANSILLVILAEAGAFVVPLIVLYWGAKREERIRWRLAPKISQPAVLILPICAGISVALASFLLNYLLGGSQVAQTSSLGRFYMHNATTAPMLVTLMLFLVIPAASEELFLRGALFSLNESIAGPVFSILLSGICFALLHGSFSNFLGPLLAGWLYAYLVYALDSIWPAIIAHFVSNGFHLMLMWIINTYSVFGIWKYLLSASVVLMILFSYISLCCLENLLLNDRIARSASRKRHGKDALSLILNPGFIAFALAFIAKAGFGIL